MNNLVISNPERFNEKKKLFLEGGKEDVQVISDFDKTLTYAFVDGGKVQSIIAILRNKNYLTEDYSPKAHALFEKYHPIEIDPNIPLDKKKKAMNSWWMEHFDLLIKSGLNKKDLENLVNEGEIEMRKGLMEFIDFLYNKKIPLVIMSAGLGDAIKLYLEQQRRLYDNVHIISNLFEWNGDGVAIGVKKPIIHSMNKDEHTLENLPIYNELKERKNVLLLGDGLGDLDMVKGFKYQNLISVGFLNENIEANMEKFKENYDVVLTGDGDFDFVNNLIKEIIK